MFIAHLHQRLRLYTIGWINFTWSYIHVMHLVRDVQLRLLRQKSLIKSTVLFWLIDEWKCASLLRSHSTVISILHEQLGMKKLSARWVSRLLTVDHKRRVISKQCLEMFQRNPDEFLHQFITVDETWIHYFTPETKKQSKQWTSLGEPASKKTKTVGIVWQARRPNHYGGCAQCGTLASQLCTCSCIKCIVMTTLSCQYAWTKHVKVVSYNWLHWSCLSQCLM